MRLFRNTVFAIILGSSILHAQDDVRYKRLAEDFICTCGCRQLLDGSNGCTMIACPNSGPMRADLRQQMTAGKSDDQIRSAFVEKYTTIVLSAPSKSGFNLAAWIMPFAVLAAGFLIIAFVVRSWRAKTAVGESAPPIDAAYQNRIEEELKKYSPED